MEQFHWDSRRRIVLLQKCLYLNSARVNTFFLEELKPDFMKLLLRSFGIIAFSAAIFLFQSCATIFGGRTNSLVFYGEGAPEAQVFVDDELVGQAPGKIVLPREVIQHGSVLEIRKEGSETQEYVLLRKPHTGYMIADFAVGGIPLIFDSALGNLYRPYPRKFDMNSGNEE